METSDREWTGTALEMGGHAMDPYGVQEVVIEYTNGDTDAFRPRRRKEYGSYELQQMAAYLDAISHSLRKGQKR